MNPFFITHSFQIENAIVDQLMHQLSARAFKVYVVIVRKTRGWCKLTDHISISQFSEITGMSKPTVVAAVKELVESGLVNEYKDNYINAYSLVHQGAGYVNSRPTEESHETEIIGGSSDRGKDSLPVYPQEDFLPVKKMNNPSQKSLQQGVKKLNTQKTNKTTQQKQGALKAKCNLNKEQQQGMSSKCDAAYSQQKLTEIMAALEQENQRRDTERLNYKRHKNTPAGVIRLSDTFHGVLKTFKPEDPSAT